MAETPPTQTPRIVLQRCKLRDTRVVPDADAPPMDLTWDKLASIYVTTADSGLRRSHLAVLRRAVVLGALLLLVKQDGGEVFLSVQPRAGSNDIRWFLSQRPEGFADSISAIHRVELAEWPVALQDTTEPPPDGRAG